MKVHRPGYFGPLVKEYERRRRPYPREVFSYLGENMSGKKDVRILDLGCGTGISTRQLAHRWAVIGCDPDPVMLAAARRHKQGARPLRYVRGEAKKLPFKDSLFDVVTTFASFHWFNNPESIAEISRVLKPGGLLFIANRISPKWGNGYRKAIIQSIGRNVAPFGGNDRYDIRKDLRASDFQKIRLKQWHSVERYSLRGAIEYVQSISIWNSIPVSEREAARAGVQRHFQKLLKKDGALKRNVTLKVVSCINNK